MSEIVILLGADGDLIELFNRFEDWRPGMGFDFDRAFSMACDLLSSHPQLGRRWRGNFRRLFIVHWNLGVFYEESGQRVLIHGIMDVRQDPDQIARRLGLR